MLVRLSTPRVCCLALLIAAAFSTGVATASAAPQTQIDVSHSNISASLSLATGTAKNSSAAVTISGHLRLHQRGTITIWRCGNTSCNHYSKQAMMRKIGAGNHQLKLQFVLAAAPAFRIRLATGTSSKHFSRTVVLMATKPPAKPVPIPVVTPAPSVPDPAPAPTPVVPTAFTITTSAGLDPAYNPAIPDYTVPCGTGGNVTIWASVLPGQSLSINGGAALTGATIGTSLDAVSQSIPLVAGQAFTFTPDTAADTSTHTVRCTPPDFPSWTVARTGTPQVQWIVMGPSDGSGGGVGGGHYAVITDNYGVPIWWMRDQTGNLIDNVSVLPSGQVAWWVPTGAGDGQDGYYQITNLDGTSPLGPGMPDHITAATSNSLGEVGANLHDFKELSNGNYLLIATVPRTVSDLAAYGDPTHGPGTVIDADIQEITPDGTLVWSWDSASHITPSETDWGYAGVGTTWDGALAYDIIHMNSIQVIDDGSCLGTTPTSSPSCKLVFSARHLDAIYEINMTSGAIIWKLGGTSVSGESLAFVGDPYGNFNGQHQAQILPDGTLTIHDNGSQVGRPPRTAHYAIDTATMTATYLGGVTDSRVDYSNCCGGATLLPGGDWLVSWGANSLVTELSPTGTPVLSLYFASGSTYRAYAVSTSSLVNYNTLIAGMNAQFTADG